MLTRPLFVTLALGRTLRQMALPTMIDTPPTGAA
jgi:hypothetical protein